MMYLDDFEGLPGCFVAGTKIQTQEGEKNIEDIKVGDKVYAFNADTKQLGLKEVKTLYIHYSEQLVKVKIDGETIEATSNHPFYVVGEGFKPAGELKQNDRVHLWDGSLTVVESVEPVECDEAVKVYNFEVADYHTYFVGDTGVLVHNMCWQTGGIGKIDYKKVFFDQNPELEGKVIVHHSIEQQVLTRYPGLFTAEEINAYEMLRGIPREVNNKVHLSDIRIEWNNFYKKVDADEIALTKENFLNKALEIDKLFGQQFDPPKQEKEIIDI